jgi:undecaprenyl-diphosphatase
MSTITKIIQKNDLLCFYALNKKFHNRLLDNIMRAVTQLGSTFTAFILSAFILLYNKNEGYILVLNLLSSQTLIQILKRIVNRPRPYKTLDWVVAINPPKCRYSLPSGHSGSAMTIALTLSSFFPAFKVLILGAALLVGVSRIYLGAHYPTDVTLGFFISYIIFKVIESTAIF